MLVLALDTATPATAVVVAERAGDGAARRLSQRRFLDPRAHGEQLSPQIHAALADAGVRPGDLGAVVAGTGPGPFTGLRVGLATAAALAQALGIPAYGVCSLDGIGAATGPAPALVATDARRREVYWAIYAGGERLTEPAVDRPADLPPILSARGVRRAYGEGARRYREVLLLPVAESPIHPDPYLLMVKAADRFAGGGQGEQLVPLYLRRPDATEPRPPKSVTP